MEKGKLIKILFVFVALGLISYIGSKYQEIQSQLPDPVTVPGEVVASFDNGDGTENHILKNDTILQVEINYPTANKDSRYFYGFKNLFDYRATRWFDLTVPNQHFEANFDVYLSEWRKIHKALKAGNSQNKTPLAGAATNEAFKQLKINGQRVDEVKEYVDAEGNTWYLWYFKDIQLKFSGNKATFE